MRFTVYILWEERCVELDAYRSRDDAEWAIAEWRNEHGSDGNDTGFKVEENLNVSQESQ